MPKGKKKAAAKTPAAKVEPTMDTATTNPALDWRDPNAKFADDDHSLQAGMWRLYQAQLKSLGRT